MKKETPEEYKTRHERMEAQKAENKRIATARREAEYKRLHEMQLKNSEERKEQVFSGLKRIGATHFPTAKLAVVDSKINESKTICFLNDNVEGNNRFVPPPSNTLQTTYTFYFSVNEDGYVEPLGHHRILIENRDGDTRQCFVTCKDGPVIYSGPRGSESAFPSKKGYLIGIAREHLNGGNKRSSSRHGTGKNGFFSKSYNTHPSSAKPVSQPLPDFDDLNEFPALS